MNYNTMKILLCKFMAFSMPLKGHEKQPRVFMVFSWVFHGFAQNLGVFMAHENGKIKGFLTGFFNAFFMLFPGWLAMKNLTRFPMKIPLKSFENPVNLPWLNSQDFHRILIHSGPGDPWNNRWSRFYGIEWNFSMEFYGKYRCRNFHGNWCPYVFHGIPWGFSQRSKKDQNRIGKFWSPYRMLKKEKNYSEILRLTSTLRNSAKCWSAASER